MARSAKRLNELAAPKAKRQGKQKEPMVTTRDIKAEEYKTVAELFNAQNRLTQLQAELGQVQRQHAETVTKLGLPPGLRFYINFQYDSISWEERPT